MPDTYIDLVPKNLANEHLCCIIRAKPNPGITAKRAWLSARLPEGHVFRKLDVKDCVFIEYAPLETAWVPVVGDNWLYIYCLWVASTQKGHGYGSALLESCIDDARRQEKSGVCMLGAEKQKAWLSDQRFARRFGFETVDITLQVIDFQLLLAIHGILLCQFSRPLQFKGRIITRVFIEFLLFNMQNFADNRI